jgi:hypothetical protein
MALAPYLLASCAAAFENNASAMTFTDDTTYLLGDSILVAPLLSNASNSREVKFPESSGWVSWFTNQSFAGGSSAIVSADLHQFPVFTRAGSVIALDSVYAHYACPYRHASTAESRPSFVLLVTHPASAGMACVRPGSSSNHSGFVAEYAYDSSGTMILSARNRGPQSVAFVVVIRHV